MKPDQRFFEQLSGKEYDFYLKNEDEIAERAKRARCCKIKYIGRRKSIPLTLTQEYLREP